MTEYWIYKKFVLKKNVDLILEVDISVRKLCIFDAPKADELTDINKLFIVFIRRIKNVII